MGNVLVDPRHVHPQLVPEVAFLISWEGVVRIIIVGQNAMDLLQQRGWAFTSFTVRGVLRCGNVMDISKGRSFEGDLHILAMPCDRTETTEPIWIIENPPQKKNGASASMVLVQPSVYKRIAPGRNWAKRYICHGCLDIQGAICSRWSLHLGRGHVRRKSICNWWCRSYAVEIEMDRWVWWTWAQRSFNNAIKTPSIEILLHKSCFNANFHLY